MGKLKTHLLLLSMISLPILSLGQEVDFNELCKRLSSEGEIVYSYTDVDVKPSFDGGGSTEFLNWVSMNIDPSRWYEGECGYSGRVIVFYVIEKDGTLTNAQILRGIDHMPDAEAIRVVSSSPKWKKPGRINGENVRVACILPVILGFHLKNNPLPVKDAYNPPVFGDSSVPFAQSFTHWVWENFKSKSFETSRDLPSRLKCVVKFIVDSEGNVSDAEIEQSSSWLHYDQAVIETILTSPQWEPATDSERRPVATIIDLPFISEFKY